MSREQAFRFMSIGSGSSGNCAWVGDADDAFLIDAGMALDKLMIAMSRHGLHLSTLRGIIVTHDHSDHVRFLYPLLRRIPGLKVYCTPRTLQGILRRHNVSRRVADYHQPIYKEHPFHIGAFTITPFEVSHDGTDNVGFHIAYGTQGPELTVATDLGVVGERPDHYLRRAQYVMLESNYDATLLAAGRYPAYLKHRIMAENGHLDNVAAAQLLSTLDPTLLRHVFLCHLSNDNNTPDIALDTSRRALPSPAIRLSVLPRHDPSPLFLLVK